jgi:TonB family protein
MNKRFKLQLTAATLTLALHAFVLAALESHRLPNAARFSTPENVLQVSLSSTGKSPYGNPGQTSEARDAVRETSLSQKLMSREPRQAEEKKITPSNKRQLDIASSETPRFMAEWLPDLSNIPFQFFEQFNSIVEPDYYPASDLEARPTPEAPVVIPFPDVPLHAQKGKAILVLYINADGIVEKIEIAKSELPVEFEKTAIDTFMRAKMSPGIKNGKPVPSRTKIEVEFEAK